MRGLWTRSRDEELVKLISMLLCERNTLGSQSLGSDAHSPASRLEEPRIELPHADTTDNHATTIRRREARTKADREPESAMNTN